MANTRGFEAVVVQGLWWFRSQIRRTLEHGPEHRSREGDQPEILLFLVLSCGNLSVQTAFHFKTVLKPAIRHTTKQFMTYANLLSDDAPWNS